MKTKIILITILSFITVLISCSKDSTTTKPPENNTQTQSNYFPDTTGNYWIMENYGIDSLNNKIGDVVSTDSIFVAGMTLKDGQNSYKHYTYNNNAISDTNYFYTNNETWNRIPKYRNYIWNLREQNIWTRSI